jgi:hypothetical protein
VPFYFLLASLVYCSGVFINEFLICELSRHAQHRQALRQRQRRNGRHSEEKHEPVSDIDTVVVDRLKALDPNRPIREADIGWNWRMSGLSAHVVSVRFLATACELD